MIEWWLMSSEEERGGGECAQKEGRKVHRKKYLRQSSISNWGQAPSASGLFPSRSFKTVFFLAIVISLSREPQYHYLYICTNCCWKKHQLLLARAGLDSSWSPFLVASKSRSLSSAGSYVADPCPLLLTLLVSGDFNNSVELRRSSTWLTPPRRMGDFKRYMASCEHLLGHQSSPVFWNRMFLVIQWP